MIVGRSTPRWRHGPTGLLMALFVVAGLIFSYGLGHGPPPRVCTAHATSVPAVVADAMAAHHGPAQAHAMAASAAFSVPIDLPPPSADMCLCLAVLLGLLALSLAAKPRPKGGRRPPRYGWCLAPPALALPCSRSLSSLQVLRL